MKKYMRIYDYYKDRIVHGQLKKGNRVPSVRKTAELFGVSKTTVENAYFALQAEGYILSMPQSGYRVAWSMPEEALESRPGQNPSGESGTRYDLESGDADRASFDIGLWHRCINSALRQEDRLCSYSDVQGEPDLRLAISGYIRENRNVIASPDRIVVGAGVLSLMNILCPLLKGRPVVSFPDESFSQGIATFSGYGFRVHTRDKDADVIYVSPSHMTRFGSVMPVRRRVDLVRYSEERHSLVIEDDYDTDFLYTHTPAPSLFTLASVGNIIYMSSFANVLTPGIRISFMVLPEPLAEQFRSRSWQFAQTASKTEQMALCSYIRDGRMAAQIRRVRRRATAKTRLFYNELQEALAAAAGASTGAASGIHSEIGENGLQIKLTCRRSGPLPDFAAHGVRVFVNDFTDGFLDLCLSPSAVGQEDIPGAAKAVAESLFS